MTPNQDVVFCHLGRAEYAATWELQRRVQDRLISAKRRGEEAHVPHVVITVEHPPVFTLGKSGNSANLLLDEQELAQRGASFFRIDRGGDITFHGPGQLVVYPILDLGRFFTDIHKYLRKLEEAVIRTCAEFGIVAERVEGRTGVWVGPDENDAERKICAMGIRCSRWVTMHGLALNVKTDLDFFSMIIPCGISDRGVTSICKETAGTVEVHDVRAILGSHLARQFGMRVTELNGDDARAFLGDFVGGAPIFTRA